MIIKRSFLFLLFIFSAFLLHAQTFPEKPNRLVNDYTNTLSQTEINQLEQKLVAFDDSTSTQVAVVMIKSLEGYDVADYAVRLAENWGIGGSKNNNGVLLLVSIGDRKVTIQTGYGVEGALPDAIARRIIENEIKPNFKSGNYFGGIDQGTSAIISYTKGEYRDARKKPEQSKGPSGFIIFLIIMAIIFLISKKGGGGGSQVIGRRGAASPFWWMLMGSGMGRSSGGGFGGFSGGGGGFGGGGGGGFGGFGGGSFGGGGASGSW
jgi:uncharacterized protein